MLFTPLTFAATCPDPSTFSFSGDKLTIKDSSWEAIDYYLDEEMLEELEFDGAFFLKWTQGYGLICSYESPWDISSGGDVASLELKKKSLTKSIKPSKYWMTTSSAGFCEQSRKACSW